SLNQFTPNANGQAERTTVVHGATSSPDGIAFKTEKETKVRDQRGHEVLQETYVYDGASYERIGWTAIIYDDRGHVTETRDHKGQVISAIWNGDLKTSETDANGVQIDFTYDSLNRIRTTTKKGIAAGGGFAAQSDITTTFSYDAESRKTAETVASGRLKNETDNAGVSTGYAYANGGRTETLTLLGGVTRITDRYLDRQIRSVVG